MFPEWARGAHFATSADFRLTRSYDCICRAKIRSLGNGTGSIKAWRRSKLYIPYRYVYATSIPHSYSIFGKGTTLVSHINLESHEQAPKGTAISLMHHLMSIKLVSSQKQPWDSEVQNAIKKVQPCPRCWQCSCDAAYCLTLWYIQKDSRLAT